MNSTVTITMDSERKKQAEQLFDGLGMDMNTAMNVFIAKCLEWNGIPFSIEHRYNAETVISDEELANRMRIHDAIVEGARQIENGELLDGETVMAELVEKYG